MVRHSLRSDFYFHHVLGILELASLLQFPHKCSRFFELTLLLVVTVSVVMSTLPELEEFEGSSEHSCVFLFFIFNDEVTVCEFLGIRDGTGGGRLFVEHDGGSGKPPEQTVTYTQRTLCGSLDSAGLLQWLVFATVPKESPSYLPIPHISHRGVFTYWCVLVSPFSSVLKCLLDCWLLNCHQMMSAACEV